MTVRTAVVVGGGVIGLTAAVRLAEDGLSVTVLEQHGAARGASIANAGWLETQTLQPLPAPDTLRFGLRSMLHPDAPLHIRPRLSLALATWLMRFAASSTDRAWESGRRSLLQLAGANGDEFREFASRHGIPLAADESLSVYGDATGAAGTAEKLGILGRPGVEVLDAAEVRRLEPFLTGAAAGGLLLRGDVVVDPVALMEGLRRTAVSQGIGLRPDRAVSFRRSGDLVTHVQTTTGDIRTDLVVIAAGHESARLTRQLGTRLAMEPGKGFSVALPLPFQPGRVVSLAHAKVGIVPHGPGARLVGTMDLSGADDRIDDRRVQGILDAAAPYIRDLPPDAADPDRRSVVLGQRPMLAGGLPVIDRLPHAPNAFVTTGHAMMGVSLALPSARLLSRFVREGERPSDLIPFRLR